MGFSRLRSSWPNVNFASQHCCRQPTATHCLPACQHCSHWPKSIIRLKVYFFLSPTPRNTSVQLFYTETWVQTVFQVLSFRLIFVLTPFPSALVRCVVFGPSWGGTSRTSCPTLRSSWPGSPSRSKRPTRRRGRWRAHLKGRNIAILQVLVPM